MTITTAFFGGIIFAFVALIAVILYNSIEFINPNRWPQDGWGEAFKDREGQSNEVKRANAEMRRKISNHKNDK